MQRFRLVLIALVATACSNAYESPALGIRYEPPRGVKLIAEEPGPPVIARFTSGLEIRLLSAVTTELDEKTLDALLTEVLTKANLPAPGRVKSSRVGTLPAGAVARFVVDYPTGPELVYVVPNGETCLLVTLSPGEARYNEMENRVELSLASLKLLR